MKHKLLFFLLSAGCLLVHSSCNLGSASDNTYRGYQPAWLEVAEKPKFDGNFSGYANETTQHLSISNINSSVAGKLKSGAQSFLLSGTVVGDRLSGVINYPLGDMPFEAYYQGPSLVMQLDKETMDVLKLMIVLVEDDASAMVLIDDKIVFEED